MSRFAWFFFFCAGIAFGQRSAAIDSVNNVAYETKIAKAATLDGVFLKNAADAQKIKYSAGQANSYSNLGLVYYYQGKYDLSVNYVLKAIKLYEQMGAKDKQASEYANLGYAMKRRDMPKAQYYMLKGKAIAEAKNLNRPLMAIYDNYGVLKEMQNQLDSALVFYNKSLLLKQKANDSLGIPYSLSNIAGVFVLEKKFDKATAIYGRALKIRTLRNDQIGIAENLANLGDLYAAKQESKQAIGYFKKSLDLCLRYHYTYLIQGNYKSLAEQYEVLKNPTEALSNYKKYTQYKDSLLNKETNSKIAELEIQFETSKKEKQLAENKNQLLEKESQVKERNVLLIGISLLSVFVAGIGFMIFRQQRLKNRQLKQEHELKTAISQIETQNELQNQRLRISRDLHDNIGAQLTFIISSVDNIKYAFDITNPKLDSKLSSISNFAKDTILELRDTIWAMNHTEITFEDLKIRILNFLEKAKEARDNVHFKFSIAPGLQEVTLTSIVGMNMYRSIQEAINNALKYADASEISIVISQENDDIRIGISDNGRGFNAAAVVRGNGLANMEKRIGDIGGRIFFESEISKGTAIVILIGQPQTAIT